MADIYKELYSIETGRYGRDIRTAIHNSLEKIDAELEEEPKTDISSELKIIASDPYGKNVKQAIYSALTKVNNAKTSTGGSAEPENIALLTTAAHPEIMRPDSAEFIPIEKWGYLDQNYSGSGDAELTAAPTSDCILLAIVRHRSETISIEGTGWEQIAKTEASYEATGILEWCTIWSKNVATGNHKVIVKNPDSKGLDLILVYVYGAKSLSVVANVLIPSASYSPPAVNGKRRIYVIHSIYASASVENTYIATDYGNIDLMSTGVRRLLVWYDYQPELRQTPQFVYNLSSYNPGSSGAIVLDIEEG